MLEVAEVILDCISVPYLTLCLLWRYVGYYLWEYVLESYSSVDFSWDQDEEELDAQNTGVEFEVIKGLPASYLEKFPKITGKDLVMGTDCCAVCLEEVESDQPARMIPGCNHGFHLHCADEWLVKNANCPICRGAIRPDFFDSSENNPC